MPSLTSLPTDPFLTILAQAWPASVWKRDVVLVGVSGGADSVALLRGLCELAEGPGKIVAAHFNHRLRESAGEDEQFVKNLCEQFKIECHVGQPEEKPPSADEAFARSARYSFLEKTACKLGATYVAVAHTQDDQAETILHRILRGTGLSGLSGIPQTRKLGPVALVRPLLNITRSEVEEFLLRLGQDYCRDETNEDVAYTRNRLRHELLPNLREQYNAQVDSALLRLAHQAAQADEVLSAAAEKLLAGAATVQKETVVLDTRLLEDQPEIVLQRMFVQIWTKQDWPRIGLGTVHLQRLAQLALQQEDAQIDFPGNICAQKSGGSLSLTRRG